MPLRRRWPKIQVRRKEVKSNTYVVLLTLDLDDATLDVAKVQIEHAKDVITWTQTLDKHFSRFFICGLQIVSYYPTLSVERFMMHECFYAYKYWWISARLNMAVGVIESELETMCKDGEMTSTWTMSLSPCGWSTRCHLR